MSSRVLVRVVAVVFAGLGLFLLVDRLRRGLPANAIDQVAVAMGVGTFLYTAYGLWVGLPSARWMAMGLAGIAIGLGALFLLLLAARGVGVPNNAARWGTAAGVLLLGAAVQVLLTRPGVRALFGKKGGPTQGP